MDAYYDTKAAREYLESIMSVGEGGDGRQLASITKVSADIMEIQMKTYWVCPTYHSCLVGRMV
jgi:hypothetical protein